LGLLFGRPDRVARAANGILAPVAILGQLWPSDRKQRCARSWHEVMARSHRQRRMMSSRDQRGEFDSSLPSNPSLLPVNSAGVQALLHSPRKIMPVPWQRPNRRVGRTNHRSLHFPGHRNGRRRPGRARRSAAESVSIDEATAPQLAARRARSVVCNSPPSSPRAPRKVEHLTLAISSPASLTFRRYITRRAARA